MNNKKYIKINKNDGYYVPLTNFKGAYSSITPFFAGDFKTDYHHYALEPTSELGLFNLERSRNVLFDVNGERYKLNGQTDIQQKDDLYYHFGQLYQTVKRENQMFSLETTSFMPLNDHVELHEIIIKNKTEESLKMNITTSIPIYGRSPDSIFDHRHVTSLLHRTKVVDSGITVNPTLSFDERGHQKNDTVYGVFANIDTYKPSRYHPVLDDFINGGSLSFPKFEKSYAIGEEINGYETIGSIGFDEVIVNKKSEIKLYIAIAIDKDINNLIKTGHKYLNDKSFNEALLESKKKIEKDTNYIGFNLESEARNEQLKWITLQPILRRFFGNSYMPHHDYGHGGRGWRDLWQDLLALIMSDDKTVMESLYDNFQGVRIDGSNATIIGSKSGEFRADRNQIVRVWSDHGAWPLLTTKMYIDETGDIEFLLKKQYYFDDQFTHYTKKTKKHFAANNKLSHQGTILEHVLLQNIVGFLNTGKHGYTRLEDADWNDGLDMAHGLGETIAFSHFYANNLSVLADLIEALPTSTIELIEDLYLLVLKEISLLEYFDRVQDFNQKTNEYDKQVVINQLRNLSESNKQMLREKAYFNGYFQSYINNDGLYQDKINEMSLTGQTMVLLNQVATKEQAKSVALKTKALLFDASIGGYRLNSNYHDILTNMGRAYGFAYGHKENGAVFAHMAVMYAYGLYTYDLVDEGYEAYQTLLDQALKGDSGVLAGIPEYFNDRGVGKYSYLTGSASWVIKLLRTEVFGIHLKLGKLSLNPKLSKASFINGKASIKTYLFGKQAEIIYYNPKNLEFGKYKINKIILEGKEVKENNFSKAFSKIEVYLVEKI